MARAGCVVATADAWSQLAQFSTRALPYRTALAVVRTSTLCSLKEAAKTRLFILFVLEVSTLIATALVEYSLPLPLGPTCSVCQPLELFESRCNDRFIKD